MNERLRRVITLGTMGAAGLGFGLGMTGAKVISPETSREASEAAYLQKMRCDFRA